MRFHLNHLQKKFGACAEHIAERFGRNKQGPTWEFENINDPVIASAAADCSKPIPLTPRRILHGAVGIAKSVMHINRASDEVIAQRRAACDGCAHLVNKKCVKCGCRFERKITNADEQCPLTPPKWGKVSRSV